MDKSLRRKILSALEPFTHRKFTPNIIWHKKVSDLPISRALYRIAGNVALFVDNHCVYRVKQCSVIHIDDNLLVQSKLVNSVHLKKPNVQFSSEKTSPKDMSQLIFQLLCFLSVLYQQEEEMKRIQDNFFQYLPTNTSKSDGDITVQLSKFISDQRMFPDSSVLLNFLKAAHHDMPYWGVMELRKMLYKTAKYKDLKNS
eukprot:CAMPEP_0201563184 /NCGR_PEP_ID=MMETSP0173_2-20130828/79743_1 /ASSEMBLY_ACC=CAM_ASM_000268 /TAXON_ID=218659 /ORGANISM="Vexillifera sp., Strain DIVA3 564/2" /LENGTH=198 /DNA_ID=CAMNT_0047977833 /DNA_START=629 /DNA_END=1221 /DNA_ORIENTATION=+